MHEETDAANRALLPHPDGWKGYARLVGNFPVPMGYYGGHCKQRASQISFRDGIGRPGTALWQKE